MLPRTAECQDDNAFPAAIHELTAHLRSDAHDLVRAHGVRLLLHEQRQAPRHHEVHLFLLQMRVNPTLLTGQQDDQVQPKALDAKFAAKALHPLVAARLEL